MKKGTRIEGGSNQERRGWELGKKGAGTRREGDGNQQKRGWELG